MLTILLKWPGVFCMEAELTTVISFRLESMGTLSLAEVTLKKSSTVLTIA